MVKNMIELKKNKILGIMKWIEGISILGSFISFVILFYKWLYNFITYIYSGENPIYFVNFLKENKKYSYTFTICTLFLIFAYVFYKAGILRRFTHILKNSWKNPYVVWFAKRNKAESDMIKSLKRYSYITFIGITNKQLDGYMRKCFNDERSVCKWKTIDIYFASDEVGVTYAGGEFLNRLKKSRQDIAMTLTSPRNRNFFPYLENVNFYQYTSPIGFSGSFYGTSKDNLKVIYIVESTPGQKNINDAITIKIEDNGIKQSTHMAVLNCYKTSLTHLSMHRNELGSFKYSPWDESAESWKSFCDISTIMKEEMNGLISVALKIIPTIEDLDIIDIACASGNTSKLLLNHNPKSLTIVDSSPRMIKQAKKVLGNERKVCFALCKVPTFSRQNIDIEKKKFDIIVLHQALPALANDRDSLLNLAIWCYRILNDGGVVLLAAHNTTIAGIDPKPVYEDKFREALRAIIEKNESLKNILREPPSISTPKPPIMSSRLIKEVFTNKRNNNKHKGAGFSLVHFETKEINVTMDDRLKMWRCPAVANSVIDVSKIDDETLQKLINETGEKVAGKDTKSRMVGYWVFKK